MLKKCLIALALLVYVGAPAMADESWGYGATTTVEWAWDEKPGPEICVKMKVVMWADLYFCDPEITCIILKQEPIANPTPGQDGGNSFFSGCICMKLCVNFKGIKVSAKYYPDVDITMATDNKGYAISIGEPGSNQMPTNWDYQPSDSIQVDTLHLSNNLKTLEICVRVKNVDPQSLEYAADMAPQDVGHVLTTLVPTIAPPGYSGTNPWSDSDYYPPAIP